MESTTKCGVAATKPTKATHTLPVQFCFPKLRVLALVPSAPVTFPPTGVAVYTLKMQQKVSAMLSQPDKTP